MKSMNKKPIFSVRYRRDKVIYIVECDTMDDATAILSDAKTLGGITLYGIYPLPLPNYKGVKTIRMTPKDYWNQYEQD